MLTTHKKVATHDDSASAADVKTADWNEVHCFALGSLVPVGVLTLVFASSGFVSSSGSGRVGAATRVDAGTYSCDISALPAAALPDGCGESYIAVPSAAPIPTALANLLISPSSGGNTLEILITDSSFSAIDPTTAVTLYFTVWSSIVTAAPPAG